MHRPGRGTIDVNRPRENSPPILLRNLVTIRKVLEHTWNKTLGFRGVFQRLPEVKAIESSAFMERAMGIEPTSEAWEALDS